MPINMPPRQVTVQDIINSDERVVNLRKTFQQLQYEKNQLILEISRAESDVIATMGAFEYLNAFHEVEEAKKELLPKFRQFTHRKRELMDAIIGKDKSMEDTQKQYEVVAQEIIKELQRKFQGSASQSCSAPLNQESCLEDCNGSCSVECTCSQDGSRDVTVKVPTQHINGDVKQP